LVAVLAVRPRMQAGLGLCSAARAPQAAMQPSPRALRSFGDDSFNDLVGEREQLRGHFETERPGGLEVDD